MLEHIFDARPVARFRLPATPQKTPNMVCEPSSLWPLGPLRPLAPKRLRNSGILVIPGKWCLPSQDLVHHHSERVTCEHQRVKRYWARSNHRLIARALANQSRRERLVRVLKKRQERLSADGELPQMTSATEYVISKEGKEFEDARAWMQNNNNDPLFEVCFQQSHCYQQMAHPHHRTSFGSSKVTSCLGCFNRKPSSPHRICLT